MKGWLKDRVLARMAHSVYRQSGIEQRFSVLPDFQPDAEPILFTQDAQGTLGNPSTGERNRMYEQSFARLASSAAKAAFDRARHLKPAEVTHVITVSCTGFTNPGPDLAIVQWCGIPLTAERYHLGFMGCYAAFPALRLADQICRANPKAVVLVVCIELCTLHLQLRPTTDSILANSLFADGAAAVLLAGVPGPTGGGWMMDGFATEVLSEGEADMAWTIGDHGFDMVLSSYVPRLLDARAAEVVERMLNRLEVDPLEVKAWAIHPGGKAILDAMEKNLACPLDDSREVLKRYGNMSSATVLFVLERMMQAPCRPGHRIGALAFGPGITVELGCFRFAKIDEEMNSCLRATPSQGLGV